jgi:predicted ATP-binding protein involved in virulence
MKLEKITIQNYRCFNHFEIQFTRGVNILIGKNGTGKSTIINALRHVLSFIFARKKDHPLYAFFASAEGLTIKSLDRLDAYYDVTIPDFCYPISIKGEVTIQNMPNHEWEIRKNSARSSTYQDSSPVFDNTNHLPVLAIYSDSYPHVKTPLNKQKYAKHILSSISIPQNFGYYQWGEESACTEVWEQRFINLWEKIIDIQTALEMYNEYAKYKELVDSPKMSYDELKKIFEKEGFTEIIDEKNGKRNLFWELFLLKQERKIITDYLIRFSQPLPSESTPSQYEVKGLEVDRRIGHVYLNVRFADGRSVLFQDLPAGYKRLYSIVLDIANRGFLLQQRNLFAVKEPEPITGVVVIDEIDLHLHPSLEQEVIQRLQRTFPEIQFIISTHSNLVIANLEDNDSKNSIINLNFEQGKYSQSIIPNLYGVGYESCLSDFMGTPPRNATVKYLAEAYLRLEKRGEINQAKKMKSDLSGLVKEENVNRIIDSFR